MSYFHQPLTDHKATQVDISTRDLALLFQFPKWPISQKKKQEKSDEQLGKREKKEKKRGVDFAGQLGPPNLVVVSMVTTQPLFIIPDVVTNP